mmetsp:Transcript_63382/g.116785  ORF Transcript_63382/g.116785 Transcript_63382/m.116785 type:complete len:212 (-) Transcript_63382:256-891(-)
MAFAHTVLPFITSLIILHVPEALVCKHDGDASCAVKQALGRDALAAVGVAVELLQEKAFIKELKDSKRNVNMHRTMMHRTMTTEAASKEHANQTVSISTNLSEAAALLAIESEKIPAVQLLPRYAKCWNLGSDRDSRDAMCLGDLKCARKDFDGRDFGDCGPEHCCSSDDVVVKTFKRWMGSTFAFVVMLLAIICFCDSNIRNIFLGGSKK